MAKKFLTSIDLNQNELQNVALHPLATAPSDPVEGQVYTKDGKLYVRHGSSWYTWGTGEGTITGISSTSPIVGSGTSGTIELSHATSGVTAASKGDTSNQTPGFGSTFKVTSGTVNDTGHMTAFAEHTVKIPNATASTSAAGLMSAADKSKLDGLTSAMQFKGTLGSGGTITSLPTASASNLGYTYQVITDGTYDSKAAKVGDMFVCASTGTSTYAWTLIPSGEQAKGTVTNVATGTGLTGGPVTTSGTISHATGSGYQHLPTGGSSGKVLRWATNDAGTWQAVDTTVTASSSNLVTSGAVKTAINGITHPEQISRATFTIGTSSTTGEVNIDTGKTIFAVTAIQGNAGVVADWKYESGKVTVTLASTPSSAVTVNVLYYGGGTIPSSVQSDYIVDSGSDSNWEWRKWASGNAECWGQFSHSFACTTQSGNGWFTSSSTQETFPSGLFSENPKFCQITGFSSDGKGLGFEMGGGLSTTKTQNFWAYRVESSATVSTYLQVYAKGRWQ